MIQVEFGITTHKPVTERIKYEIEKMPFGSVLGRPKSKPASPGCHSYFGGSNSQFNLHPI